MQLFCSRKVCFRGKCSLMPKISKIGVFKFYFNKIDRSKNLNTSCELNFTVRMKSSNSIEILLLHFLGFIRI